MESRWRKSTAIANILLFTFQKWHSCLSSLSQHGLSFPSLNQPLFLPFPEDRGSNLGPHPLSDLCIEFRESVNLGRKTIFVFTNFKLKCSILFNPECRQQSIGILAGPPTATHRNHRCFPIKLQCCKCFKIIVYIHSYFEVMVVTRPTTKSYYLML